MPAHCPLPSEPLLPESAAGAKSFHLHVWEMGQRNGKIQPSVEASWESSLCWDPRALLGSRGLCPWAVRRGAGGLGGFYSSWPPALTALDGSTVGAVGCGSACRRSPSSLVSPLPRLAGATAHPVPFQGDSRGKQRTPHNCDCTGGEKKTQQILPLL